MITHNNSGDFRVYVKLTLTDLLPSLRTYLALGMCIFEIYLWLWNDFFFQIYISLSMHLIEIDIVTSY